jgi:NAD-dependent deacetylase
MTLKQILAGSENIVFFGGAGVSTESGIPDFRSTDGLYNQQWDYPPETILSHSFFMENPGEFYRFYRAKILLDGAKPNKAHIALAKLEHLGKLRAVVTQNIDGLHQAAGSVNVLELHGSVAHNHCMDCGEYYGEAFVRSAPEVPRCAKCGGIVKPDVVLYEESLDSDVISRTVSAIRRADVLIVGGTSLSVYPAASFIEYYEGTRLVLINKSETAYDRRADMVIHDSIGKVLSEAV